MSGQKSEAWDTAGEVWAAGSLWVCVDASKPLASGRLVQPQPLQGPPVVSHSPCLSPPPHLVFPVCIVGHCGVRALEPGTKHWTRTERCGLCYVYSAEIRAGMSHCKSPVSGSCLLWANEQISLERRDGEFPSSEATGPRHVFPALRDLPCPRLASCWHLPPPPALSKHTRMPHRKTMQQY